MTLSKSHYMIGISILVVCMLVSFAFSGVQKGKIEKAEPLPARQTIRNFNELEETYVKSLAQHVSTERLKEVVDLNANYKSKFPFPHTYYDGLFPMDVLEAVEKEIPDAPKVKAGGGCVEGSQKCYNTKLQKHKNAFDDERFFGPATLSLFTTLKSAKFTKFLEQLTGIENLVPDPEYRGSGVHQTLSGGQLNIHADFNRYEKYDLHRRVNVFVFLNPSWNESYGGQLELWSRDLKSCGAKINPDLGRFVVFSSTDFSYHGHPHPLTCPENRSRRSLALYYYTKTRPTNECIEDNCLISHSTRFQKTECPNCSDAECAHLPAKRYYA
jgi:hypothetical protein